jgi:threonine dehydrogenase-like Zn-dependent dehydrogenase
VERATLFAVSAATAWLAGAFLCANTRGVGVDRDGAFAEYAVLPGKLWRHKPGIGLDVAAMFDSFGNAVHTALVSACAEKASS